MQVARPYKRSSCKLHITTAAVISTRQLTQARLRFHLNGPESRLTEPSQEWTSSSCNKYAPAVGRSGILSAFCELIGCHHFLRFLVVSSRAPQLRLTHTCEISVQK